MRSIGEPEFGEILFQSLINPTYGAFLVRYIIKTGAKCKKNICEAKTAALGFQWNTVSAKIIK
jgi:hypothetical protein